MASPTDNEEDLVVDNLLHSEQDSLLVVVSILHLIVLDIRCMSCLEPAVEVPAYCSAFAQLCLWHRWQPGSHIHSRHCRVGLMAVDYEVSVEVASSGQ